MFSTILLSSVSSDDVTFLSISFCGTFFHVEVPQHQSMRRNDVDDDDEPASSSISFFRLSLLLLLFLFVTTVASATMFRSTRVSILLYFVLPSSIGALVDQEDERTFPRLAFLIVAEFVVVYEEVGAWTAAGSSSFFYFSFRGQSHPMTMGRRMRGYILAWD